MITDKEKYLRLQRIPHVRKDYIYGGARVADIRLTYKGIEVASKTDFYTRGKLVSQYYVITNYGNDLLKEHYADLT